MMNLPDGSDHRCTLSQIRFVEDVVPSADDILNVGARWRWATAVSVLATE